MLSAYFDARGRRFRALHEGPWGALLEGFARTLFETGYPTSTDRKHVGAAEHVLHWVTKRRWSVADLNEQSLVMFDRHLGRCQCRSRHADRTHVLYGARLFVQCLREAGHLATPATHDETKDPVLLRTFGRWMQEQRGTSAATLSNYARPIRALLVRHGEDPSRLDARGLRGFVLERHRATGWAAAKTCTTALRMFLRFLIADGQCAVGLDAAIPTLAHWRLAALPR